MKHVTIIIFALALCIMCSYVVYAAGISYELLSAVEKNDLQRVKELLRQGADVQVKDAHGATPLLKAARYGYTEIAALLIEKGADVNAKDDAIGMTPLILAASRGHTDTTKLLIEKGADPNAKAKDGRTSLMGAAYSGFIDIAKLLIVKGADVNAKDVMDETALAKAERRGMTDMAALLRMAGAK